MSKGVGKVWTSFEAKTRQGLTNLLNNYIIYKIQIVVINNKYVAFVDCEKYEI